MHGNFMESSHEYQFFNKSMLFILYLHSWNPHKHYLFIYLSILFILYKTCIITKYCYLMKISKYCLEAEQTYFISIQKTEPQNYCVMIKNLKNRYYAPDNDLTKYVF